MLDVLAELARAQKGAGVTRGAAPARLGEFQASFGAMVRTPLERATGTRRATPDAYPATIEAAALSGHTLGAPERLAVRLGCSSVGHASS